MLDQQPDHIEREDQVRIPESEYVQPIFELPRHSVF